MNARAAVLVFTLVLGACERTPINTVETDNPDVRLDVLFTHGDCTMYRFPDRTRLVYFSTCSDAFRSETVTEYINAQ